MIIHPRNTLISQWAQNLHHAKLRYQDEHET